MAALPPNVEPSAYHHGEYVAYDGQGNPWRVYKERHQWRAKPGNNHPGRDIAHVKSQATLSGIAHTLAERRPARVVEPF